jgi:hypothetical protein
MYDTSNRLLDDIGYRLATWLCERGHATVCRSRVNLSVNCRVKMSLGGFKGE